MKHTNTIAQTSRTIMIPKKTVRSPTTFRYAFTRGAYAWIETIVNEIQGERRQVSERDRLSTSESNFAVKQLSETRMHNKISFMPTLC